MLTAFTGKHTLAGWREERTRTLSHSPNSAPPRVGGQGLPNSPLNSGGKSPARRPKRGGPRRKVRILPPKLRVKRRQPVTVCAAAICQMGEESVLVGISDRMLTSRDVEFESRHTKVYGFAPANVVCLGAGDADATFEICAEVHPQVMTSGAVGVGAVADLFARSHAALRRRRLERLWLAPLGLDLAAFVSRQQRMDPGLVSELAEKMLDESGDLGAEAIITGVDSTGPHIYHINDPGTGVCCDRCGFMAIGLGGRHFETLFMSAGYDSKWPLAVTLLLAFQAKKLAELAPGVGKTTDVFIMDKRGLHAFSPLGSLGE